MKTLITAVTVLAIVFGFGAIVLGLVLAASLIHPLAPLGVIFGLVCAIMIYAEKAGGEDQ
ncbi:MAG: hypothetical protein WAU17_02505 [Nitrospirales bacterium]